MTLDGVSDHTEGIPDKQIHQYYTELMDSGDAILYGRTTYQLMEFWRQFLEKPSNELSMNDFARAINRIPKIVFSNTLKKIDWKTASLAHSDLAQMVEQLKHQAGNEIFVGSRSLIIQLTNLNLIDEYQICIHPVIAGKGQQLFENITDRTLLKLIKTKTFDGGAVILYYERMNR